MPARPVKSLRRSGRARRIQNSQQEEERPLAKGDDIQERLIEFAVNVMELCDGLPRTFAGRHVGEQLFRAGTAGSSNYAEARGAESLNDFIHKLGIVRKELNESLVWLRILEKRGIGRVEEVQALSSECDQLCRIISSSRKTAEGNARQAGKRESRHVQF
jgi:four helix bundle protein